MAVRSTCGVAGRPLCKKFGTYLRVLCEAVRRASSGTLVHFATGGRSTTYAGVNGVEMDAFASIRVVPPSFRSLVGMENLVVSLF